MTVDGDSTATPPKVTVIIPTYNRARYLGEAIRSALAQTYGDFELIVVDDGSTDATAELVGAYRDRRLRYLSQPHRGISAAVNLAIRSARGGYIARLDSDDLWFPDMLATLVPVLDAEPEIGVVYGRGQGIDDEGRRLPHTQGLPERFPDDSLRSLLYDNSICNVALVARRACFNRAGLYDETLLANEDWDMWLRVARHYRFAFVDRALAGCRRHSDNLTGPASPQFAAVLDARAAVLDKLFGAPDLPPAARAMKSTAYANMHLSRGLCWLEKGDWKRAGREFGLAFRASDRGLTMTIRIVWFAVALPTLTRCSLGRRLAQALADFRRRRRALLRRA